MKLNYLVILGVASLLTFGCAREATVNQPSADTARPSIVSTVNSPTNLAQSSPQPAPRSGTFVSAEEPTQGTARIISEGKRYLELDRALKLQRDQLYLFSYIVLIRQRHAKDYVNLGPLQKLSGLNVSFLKTLT